MKDRPGVIAPPPLIFVAAFAAGWFTRDFVPRFTADKTAVVLGVAAILLLSWGFTEMTRAGTNVDPYQPSTALVTTGPFRFTRNPLYLSLHLLYIAAALMTGALSSLILLPLANAALYFGVIRREERYLEAKFGDSYRAYRANVRRWL